MSRTHALLELDPAVVRRARSLARKAAAPVVKIASSHTTVSVERATLRLAGLSGADHERVPWVNHLVTAVRDEVGLEHGVTTPVYDALLRGEAPDLTTLAQKAASGNVVVPAAAGREAHGGPSRGGEGRRRAACARIDRARATRDRLIKRHGDPRTEALDLPHRRDRRHLRGHPAGPGGRARGRRRHRRHPLDRAVAARLRPRGRHARGLRRHLRDAGELPAHARRARRRRARSSAATCA